jgi:hypothetical protein
MPWACPVDGKLVLMPMRKFNQAIASTGPAVPFIQDRLA